MPLGSWLQNHIKWVKNLGKLQKISCMHWQRSVHSVSVFECIQASNYCVRGRHSMMVRNVSLPSMLYIFIKVQKTKHRWIFFNDFFHSFPKSHNMNFIAFRHQEVKTSKCQTCNKEQRKALLQEEVCQCQIHKDKCGYSESSSHGEHLLHFP